MADTGPQLVPANLVQKSYNNKLENKVESRDIFGGWKGDLGTKGTLPGTIIVSKFEKGKRVHELGIVMPLSGAAAFGRKLVGTPEKLTVYNYTAYANETKKAVQDEAFGIDHVADSPYGLYEMMHPMLSDYMEKLKGVQRRQALVEGYSHNLVEAPSSVTLGLNANIYVGGVALASQPAFSDTLATYKTNINTAIPDTPTSANQMTPATIRKLATWVKSTKKIRPLKGMRDKYILTVPSNQKDALMNPEDGLGKYFSASSKPEQCLKGWLGEFDCFIFVEDERAPVITATDGASAVLTVSYYSVDDSRPTADADNWDVSFILGGDAILEYSVEKLHYEYDKTEEYGRIVKLAAFDDTGDQIIQYDLGTDDTLNQGSALALFSTLGV